MTLSERKDLLSRPLWTYKDVMLYCGVKKSKASLIMKTCKDKLNGKVFYDDHKVKRESVLAYMETTLDKEKDIIKALTEQSV